MIHQCGIYRSAVCRRSCCRLGARPIRPVLSPSSEVAGRGLPGGSHDDDRRVPVPARSRLAWLEDVPSCRRRLHGFLVLLVAGQATPATAANVTFGRKVPGSQWLPMGADYKRSSRFTLSQAGSVTDLVAYLDGLGADSGSQVVRFALYADQAGEPGRCWPSRTAGRSLRVTQPHGSDSRCRIRWTSRQVPTTSRSFRVKLERSLDTRASRSPTGSAPRPIPLPAGLRIPTGRAIRTITRSRSTPWSNGVCGCSGEPHPAGDLGHGRDRGDSHRDAWCLGERSDELPIPVAPLQPGGQSLQRYQRGVRLLVHGPRMPIWVPRSRSPSPPSTRQAPQPPSRHRCRCFPSPTRRRRRRRQD